jgi:hypothetical protein
LKKIFEREGLIYFVDSEGDIGGFWGDATFHFLLFQGDAGEVLAIISRYPGSIDMSQLAVVRRTLDESMLARPWPNAQYRIDDVGRIRVHISNTIDYEYGATDAQLLQHLRCAIATANMLYSSLDEALGR